MLYDELKSLGINKNKGNILGVQPYLIPQNYFTQNDFQNCLESYILEAKNHGYINDNTVVVFPEHIGSWLLISGEGSTIQGAKSFSEIIQGFYADHGSELTKYMGDSKACSKEIAAVFRFKASSILESYTKTFSYLASKYKIEIVAGSLVLPNPEIRDGFLTISDGDLYNTSVVFDKNGNLYPEVTKKSHLVSIETAFLERNTLPNPTYDTSLGKISVLICADSWHADSYLTESVKSTNFIVVPSYQTELGLWDKPWKGYGGKEDEDKDILNDIGKITEGDAWKKYALYSKIKLTSAYAGINVFLKGDLWDMGANSGHSMVVRGDFSLEICTDKAGLINLWL